jgi:hypothetical protein
MRDDLGDFFFVVKRDPSRCGADLKSAHRSACLGKAECNSAPHLRTGRIPDLGAKKPMHRKLPLFLFGLLALIAPVEAQESLFNGKDLTGWKGLPQFWTVQDGVIVGETTKENPTKGNTFLVWQGGEVADFEITAEVRFKGNNSGLQYRSESGICI